MMPNEPNGQRTLSNVERYLPFMYPILMPLLTLKSFKIPILSVQDALSYWLFTGFIQFVILLIINKVIYTTAYPQVVRWFIASFLCFSAIFVCVYVEYNFVHFTKNFADPNPWVTGSRYSINIIILISLLESIKAFNERSKFNTDNIKLQNENTKAQFNLLLQQINPHFLFNSLTTLQAMIRSKDKQTEEFILKLKEVYQQILKREKGTVTVKEELDFFNAYMYLITLRQGRAVVLDVSVSDKSLSYHIPTYTLQLLAENCIKHNIASESKPLFLSVYQKDTKSITVANNYQPKQIKAESFGIGIENLQKRYMLAGIENGVTIKQNESMYETTIKLF